jgi:hypothetical protein
VSSGLFPVVVAFAGPWLMVGWMLWLTRNDYAEGYRAGYFAASHGMDNDYAEATR